MPRRNLRRSERRLDRTAYEYARMMSVGCIDCGGDGFATRYDFGDREFRVFCGLCLMGVLVAQRNRDNILGQTTPDLAEGRHSYLRLREIGDGTLDSPFRYRRDEWDSARDQAREKAR